LRRIRWAPAAADDLQAIRDYLRQYHPAFVQTTVRRLYDAARSLKRFPNRGRIGQIDNTRELVTTPLPYIIVYRVDPECVHIFRIIHAAEERPK
jgi:addiction module RelE/StbE family toxin